MFRLFIVLLIAGLAGCTEQPATPGQNDAVVAERKPDRTTPAPTESTKPQTPAPAGRETTAADAEPGPTTREESVEAVTEEPERPKLDLSAPTTLDFLGEPVITEPGSKSGFDPKPLFRANDPDNFSLSLAPSFAEPENEEQTLPTVDGGSVSIEVQTP